MTLISCHNQKDKETSNDSLTEKVAVNSHLLDDTKLYGGNLIRIDSFPSKYIVSRPVDIWIPEDYSNDNKYSVLYMHDGQMLFDSTSTWNKQEWKVDEWATKLMKEDKVADFIVVAVHNIAKIRWQDLYPQKSLDFMDDKIKASIADISGNKDFKLNGDNYLKFLVKELKPFVDKQYSVTKDREHTFVMGSSMGGLMSMYAISEYPEIFGGAACLSTHWSGAIPQENNPFPDAIFSYMENNLPKSGTHKLYFDYGNQTLDQYYPKFAPRLDAILQNKEYTHQDAKNLFFEGTDHSENSWNQRLDKPLLFLLGNK